MLEQLIRVYTEESPINYTNLKTKLPFCGILCYYFLKAKEAYSKDEKRFSWNNECIQYSFMIEAVEFIFFQKIIKHTFEQASTKLLL